jgi:hypothetical protein
MMAPCKRSLATRKTIPHRNRARSGVFDSLVGQQRGSRSAALSRAADAGAVRPYWGSRSNRRHVEHHMILLAPGTQIGR